MTAMCMELAVLRTISLKVSCSDNDQEYTNYKYSASKKMFSSEYTLAYGQFRDEIGDFVSAFDLELARSDFLRS